MPLNPPLDTLSFAHKEMPKCVDSHCNRSHEPNEETANVLRDIDQDKNLIEHESLDDFWRELGV